MTLAAEPVVAPSPRVAPQPAAWPARSSVPQLQNGDRLTRAEFERRYEAMPGVKKAELIEGIVYMPSPVRLIQHGKPHAQLATWVTIYATRTPGLEYGDNSTARLDPDNAPQPDVLLMIPKGGSAKLDDDGYVVGSPELVCEIAASTVSIDLHAKLNAYRRNGVAEYVVWRVEDAAVDFFDLVDGAYIRREPDADGVWRSRAFPGLWLDVGALLAGDFPKLLAALDAGTATPEHAAFAARVAPSAT